MRVTLRPHRVTLCVSPWGDGRANQGTAGRVWSKDAVGGRSTPAREFGFTDPPRLTDSATAWLDWFKCEGEVECLHIGRREGPMMLGTLWWRIVESRRACSGRTPRARAFGRLVPGTAVVLAALCMRTAE